jgi:hypothetical protein
MTNHKSSFSKSVSRFMEGILNGQPAGDIADTVIRGCLADDLVVRQANGVFTLTAAGHSFLARQRHQGNEDIGAFRGQHMQISTRNVVTDDGVQRVNVNDCESPLAWLARRKGRDGRPMIERLQFVAGERLRGDFTRGQLMPRITSSWSPTSGQRTGGGGAGEMTDMIVASRQRFNQAMQAVGPEFAGVLTDVCCFLRGLEEIERQRNWPSRSAKVVLQLALDRLVRHYGLAEQASGVGMGKVQTWLAEDVVFTTEIGN